MIKYYDFIEMNIIYLDTGSGGHLGWQNATHPSAPLRSDFGSSGTPCWIPATGGEV